MKRLVRRPKPAKKPDQPEDTSVDLNQAFVFEYNRLVVKHQRQLAAIPNFIRRDDGTFSLVIQMVVAPVKDQNNLNPGL